MEELQTQMDNILKKYPQFNRLFDDDQYPINLTEYDYAHFICTQIYHQYRTIFIPVMLPGNHSYLLTNESGLYGHTHTHPPANIQDQVRVWSLIKFTHRDIMNRELNGKLTFTKFEKEFY
jgi:hypothetical protein